MSQNFEAFFIFVIYFTKDDKEEMLHRAIKIADKAHKGQTDKYAPYIAHVMRVMEYGKTMDEKL
jgi:(p)ppGpp synthase/HD superfamily hydrolase